MILYCTSFCIFCLILGIHSQLSMYVGSLNKVEHLYESNLDWKLVAMWIGLVDISSKYSWWCVVRSCQTRWFGETTPYIYIRCTQYWWDNSTLPYVLFVVHCRYVRYLSDDPDDIKIKTKLCNLVQVMMSRRDDLTFRQEMKFRNKLVEYLTGKFMRYP